MFCIQMKCPGSTAQVWRERHHLGTVAGVTFARRSRTSVDSISSVADSQENVKHAFVLGSILDSSQAEPGPGAIVCMQLSGTARDALPQLALIVACATPTAGTGCDSFLEENA